MSLVQSWQPGNCNTACVTDDQSIITSDDGVTSSIMEPSSCNHDFYIYVNINVTVVVIDAGECFII